MRIWAYAVDRICTTKRECLRAGAWIYQVEVSPTSRSVEIPGTREAGFNGITCVEEVSRRNRAMYDALYGPQR